ncbi:MAG: hypothetical protein ACOYIQ_06670 [Christensenellales bacterium]
MTKDLNSVFGDLSADLSTALPETIDVNAVKSTTLDGASGVGGGGFVLQLSIGTFNNYTNEDITELTNEIMQTAGAFMKRKEVVFG